MFFRGQKVKKSYGRSKQGLVVDCFVDIFENSRYTVKWSNNNYYNYYEHDLVPDDDYKLTIEEVLGV